MGRKASRPVEDGGSEIVWRGPEALRALLVPLGDLHPDLANVRLHPERNLSAIAASLARFGQQKATVHDAGGVMRAGNGTLEAARSLGWTHLASVPSDLAGSEATAYAIADNRTADLGGFDEPALAGLLDALRTEGYPVEVTGFTPDEVDALLGGLGEPAGEVVDDPAGEWEGMPEFENEDQMSKFRAIVHFRNEEDMRAFEELVGQMIPTNTRAIWYPKAERQVVRGTGYVSGES